MRTAFARAASSEARNRTSSAVGRDSLIGRVEQQVLEHGEPGNPARDLECARQARGGDTIRAPAGDVTAGEADAAAIGGTTPLMH